MSKYRNKKVIIDGIKFDSKKEASRYEELKLLHKCETDPSKRPMIIDTQPEFILQPKFTHELTGQKIRAIKYRADFKITYEDGHIEYEDVKASAKFQTQVYKLKKKMLLFNYHKIIFKEIF